jgi:TPR repeat protein
MKTVANLYNPHEQSKEELIAGFVVRLPLFEKLFKVIKDSDMQFPEQHYLIEAQRGMGKTTLLLRLSYEIENDAELNQWLIPLVFKEESYYHISRLFKLWEHCASLLEDKLPEFSGLTAQMESLQAEDYERACFELLLTRLKQQQKKLLLFIDNIGEMFMSFDDKDCRRLREVLMTCPYLRIFGATSVTLEAYFNYQHPFYEFFKKISLPNLGKEDTHTLLQELAKQGGAQQEQLIQTIIEQQPGRVESLRILTGGVVRSIVLLFELFLDQKNGDSLKDLDKVLDAVTPLYKHRMDDLKPLQREVVDAIALNWDAITPEEIARATRRDVAEVSEALASLDKFFIVQRVATETSIDLYQLQERFFNIWYLMRNAPKQSQVRVVWLVRFLQSWYDADSLTQRARKHIQALQSGHYYPKAAFYFAEAMAATGHLDEDTQHELLQQTKAFLANKDKELMQALSPSDKELFQQAMSFFWAKIYRQTISLLLKIQQKNEEVCFYLGYCYVEIGNYVEAEKYYLIAVEKGVAMAMNNLANIYCDEKQDYDKAEPYYLMAIANGEKQYAIRNLANLYKNQKQDYDKAEQYYLMAVEKGDARAMNGLAWFYFEQHKKQADALKLAEQAVAKEKNIHNTHTLACIYVWENQLEKANETAAFFLHEEESYQKFEQDMVLYLMLLLAKQQYASLADYFNTPHKNYRDRFKPLYYAYLNLSQHPDFAKCPPELTEPVNDILQKVAQLQRDYA